MRYANHFASAKPVVLYGDVVWKLPICSPTSEPMFVSPTKSTGSPLGFVNACGAWTVLERVFSRRDTDGATITWNASVILKCCTFVTNLMRDAVGIQM